MKLIQSSFTFVENPYCGKNIQVTVGVNIISSEFFVALHKF